MGNEKNEFNRFDAVFNSPIGYLGIKLNDGVLVELQFLTEQAAEFEHSTPEANGFSVAIRTFLDDPTVTPDVPVRPTGTDHQKRVWQALQKIPAGSVLTYGEMATRLGSGARAVGNACRRNPIPLLIPCHRLVAKNGLGGFAGEQGGRLLEIKRCLLAREGAIPAFAEMTT